MLYDNAISLLIFDGNPDGRVSASLNGTAVSTRWRGATSSGS